MSRKGYIIHDQQAVYFLTFTVVGWIDIFTRQHYRDIVIESFKFCQLKKGLHLHAFVIMSNHVHVIVSVDNGFTISGFVPIAIGRDCKKFTSNQIMAAIENSVVESRRQWMLHQFKYYASLHTRPDSYRDETYQLWEHDNHPIELNSPAFTQQKIDYIHDNPVRAGLVYRPEDYIYSSASNYAGIDQIIEVDCLFF